MKLIIVESPTKARTFNQILKGKDYFVFATLGHIRDLPSSRMAVDFAKNFKPDFIIIRKKQKVVAELKGLIKKSDTIILATDPDREGESISYHVAYLVGLVKEKWPNFSLVKGKKKLIRIVFHEITKHALDEALENPSELRNDLIKAQQARRILDRIVGYELSPLLWKKTGKNWLSAGRVQTVALRLIVEREKEIVSFNKEKHFQIYGSFHNGVDLRAKLISKLEISYEQSFTINLFAGEYTYTKTTINDENVKVIQNDLRKDAYVVNEIKESINKRYPPAPFTTSLLQQEGFNRFGYSSKMVMKLAQDLYETGLITYHRTDSFNLSAQFVVAAQKFIRDTYGPAYALDRPRLFKTKSKLAQEAHEAIRPTKLNKDVKNLPEDQKLTVNHKKLYQLIFDRTIACQMKEADIKQVKIFIKSLGGYLFESDYQQVLFDGFLKVLNPDFIEKNNVSLPIVSKSKITLTDLELKESFTQPPARYNEASIIRLMEEKGIGRPSTYAPIISLIQDKGYVEKENRYFFPTILGTTICDYLSKAFPQIFDISFTVRMEESLDEIAEGTKLLINVLEDFYQPFKKQLAIKREDKELIKVEEQVSETCPRCAKPLIMRYSKFGKFLACSGFPACKFTKPFLKIVPDVKCPQCKGDIVIRYTKSRKRFYGCINYPTCKYSAWKINEQKHEKT